MFRNLAVMICASIALGCGPKPAEPERIIDVTQVDLTLEEKQYIKDHPVVTWAAEDNRPPAVFIDAHGVIKGRVPTYLGVISKKTGLAFKPLPVGSLSEAIAAVNDKQIDLVTNVRPNTERNKDLVFTIPFASNQAVFLFRHDAPRSPLRAAIQKGDAAKQYLQSSFPGIEIVETDDHEESISLLQRGLIDFVMLNEPSADYYSTKIANKFIKVHTDFIYYAAFACRKENHLACSIISKAIGSISLLDRETLNDHWKRS